MERKGFDISASVTFGNQHVGASKHDAPTFLTTGDASVVMGGHRGPDAASTADSAPKS